MSYRSPERWIRAHERLVKTLVPSIGEILETLTVLRY